MGDFMKSVQKGAGMSLGCILLAVGGCIGTLVVIGLLMNR
jgi:hypothetical protein